MKSDGWKHVHKANSDSGGIFYFIGVIGALVYYIQLASGFWEIILAILKSLVWPAFFVYHIFQFLEI